MNGGLITINNDNRKLMRALLSTIEKAIQFTQEAMATITAIKKIYQQMSIIVRFQHAKGHPGKTIEFKQDS